MSQATISLNHSLLNFFLNVYLNWNLQTQRKWDSGWPEVSQNVLPVFCSTTDLFWMPIVSRLRDPGGRELGWKGPYPWALIQVSPGHRGHGRVFDISSGQKKEWQQNQVLYSQAVGGVSFWILSYPVTWACRLCPTLDSNNMHMMSLSRCAAVLANFIQSPQAQIKK